MTEITRHVNHDSTPIPADSFAPESVRMPETEHPDMARWLVSTSPSPRRVGPGLRLGMFLLASCVLLFNCGCPSMRLWERKPSLPKVDPPLSWTATPEEILAKVNLNAYSEFSPEGLKSYRCDDVRVRMQGIPAPMRASMVVEAPRNLRLRVAHPLTGGEAVDIGSNEERFWMWAKESQPANVLVCAHDQIAIASQVTSLPLPFRPDWLMEVLGVTPISGSQYEVHRSKPKSPIAELVSVQRTADQQVRRIVTVNTVYGVVLDHRVESMDGKMIAQAKLSNHWRDPSTRLILPRTIAIDWPAADQHLALTLELNTVEFNPASASPAMWQVPHMSDYPEIDLGEHAIRQLGHSGKGLASQPGQDFPPGVRPGRIRLEDDLEAPDAYGVADSDAESWTAGESLDSIKRPIRRTAMSREEESAAEPESELSVDEAIEEVPPANESSAARPFPGGR
jgi:hypothetical protein